MRLLDRIHRKWLIWALKRTYGNKTRAAKLLGISVRTLRIWEIKFGLRHEQLPSRKDACAGTGAMSN